MRRIAIVGWLTVCCFSSLVACGGGDPGTATPAASATAASAPDPDTPDADAVAVRVESVMRQPMSALYATSTTLRSDKEATLTARTAGVLEKILVEEGNDVVSGQKLAQLENEQQAIEYARSKTTFETKLREFNRSKKLHEQGLVSDDAFDTVQREMEEARHSASLAELELSRTEIRAPFSGRIVLRHIDPGATISNGTALFDIADLSPLYADIEVPERQISRLEVGQNVRIQGDRPDQVSQARIERIAPIVNTTSGTVKVTVAVQPKPGLRPGSFTLVQIVTDVHEDALVVPRSALVAEGSRWHLFRVNSAVGEVERLEVKLGYEEGDQVEILPMSGKASLLVEGDAVVSVGASALRDGTPVEIIEEDLTERLAREREEVRSVAA